MVISWGSRGLHKRYVQPHCQALVCILNRTTRCHGTRHLGLEQLKLLLHNAATNEALDAQLRASQTVFFLHLLGLVTLVDNVSLNASEPLLESCEANTLAPAAFEVLSAAISSHCRRSERSESRRLKSRPQSRRLCPNAPTLHQAHHHHSDSRSPTHFRPLRFTARAMTLPRHPFIPRHCLKPH